MNSRDSVHVAGPCHSGLLEILQVHEGKERGSENEVFVGIQVQKVEKLCRTRHKRRGVPWGEKFLAEYSKTLISFPPKEQLYHPKYWKMSFHRLFYTVNTRSFVLALVTCRKTQHWDILDCTLIIKKEGSWELGLRNSEKKKVWYKRKVNRHSLPCSQSSPFHPVGHRQRYCLFVNPDWQVAPLRQLLLSQALCETTQTNKQSTWKLTDWVIHVLQYVPYHIKRGTGHCQVNVCYSIYLLDFRNTHTHFALKKGGSVRKPSPGDTSPGLNLKSDARKICKT